MQKNISYKIIEKKPINLWSLSYLKNYLRITHDYDDELIASLVEAAIEMAENYTGFSLHQKVICMHIKRTISTTICPKYTPIIDILKFNKIINKQGDKEEINPRHLEIDSSNNIIGLNKVISGAEIELVYIAGHHGSAVDLTSSQKDYNIEIKQVPYPVQTAILLLLENFYERGVEDNVSHYEALKYLLPYRKIKI